MLSYERGTPVEYIQETATRCVSTSHNCYTRDAETSPRIELMPLAGATSTYVLDRPILQREHVGRWRSLLSVLCGQVGQSVRTELWTGPPWAERKS